MSMRKSIVTLACAVAVVGGTWLTTSAYDQYTTAAGVNTNCGACHGDFRSSSYTSLADGQSWGNLHNLHRQDMLGGRCEACHSGGDRWPVNLSFSDDVALSNSCSGCHGRSQDGTGFGREGWGAGLRQHHFRAGVANCAECHERSDLGGLTDANPLYFIPVGENVLPPYYASGDPDVAPTDPCGVENFAGATIGLDNDGDGFHDPAFQNWDGTDANCGATPSPGEASRNSAKSGQGLAPLTATGAGSSIDVRYGAACTATDHRIAYGPLDMVSSYTYSGQQCGIGTDGTAGFLWSPPAGNLFFLVVGNDASSEGGYGYNSGLDLDGDGSLDGERPEDATSTDCPLAQDLTSRCDNP